MMISNLDTVNHRWIPFIEASLNIKLYSWQKDYLIHGREMPRDRGIGRTTAYCIRLCLHQGTYLTQKSPHELSDIPDNNHYVYSFFIHELFRVYSLLESYGLRTTAMSEWFMSNYVRGVINETI